MQSTSIQYQPHQMSRRKKAVFGICVCLTVFGLLEGAARLLTDSMNGSRFSQINQIVMFLGTHESDLMLEYDAERFWKLKPSITINDPNNLFWQGVVSNSHGFRSSEFDLRKPDKTFRIVCFGDSSTFGIGNPIQDTWPRQLEQLLNEGLPEDGVTFQVINAGVPGYTSYQGLIHMRQEMDRLNPDLVLTSYANNDFWHWDQQTDRQHAKKINESSPVRDAMMCSRLAQLMAAGITNLRSNEDRQTTGPSQHWAEAASLNYANPRPDWIRRVPLKSFRENIAAMAEICDAHGISMIPVKWPDQPQAAGKWSPRIEYQDVLEEIARDRQLPVVDVVSLFQQNRSWSVRTYIPNDIVHVNRDGNRLAAQAAYAAVTELILSRMLSTN